MKFIHIKILTLAIFLPSFSAWGSAYAPVPNKKRTDFRASGSDLADGQPASTPATHKATSLPNGSEIIDRKSSRDFTITLHKYVVGLKCSLPEFLELEEPLIQVLNKSRICYGNLSIVINDFETKFYYFAAAHHLYEMALSDQKNRFNANAKACLVKLKQMFSQGFADQQTFIAKKIKTDSPLIARACWELMHPDSKKKYLAENKTEATRLMNLLKSPKAHAQSATCSSTATNPTPHAATTAAAPEKPKEASAQTASEVKINSELAVAQAPGGSSVAIANEERADALRLTDVLANIRAKALSAKNPAIATAGTPSAATTAAVADPSSAQPAKELSPIRLDPDFERQLKEAFEKARSQSTGVNLNLDPNGVPTIHVRSPLETLILLLQQYKELFQQEENSLQTREAELQIISYLDQHDFLNIRDQNGQTAAHFAAKYGCLSAVKHLHQKLKMPIDLLDSHQNCPLIYAAAQGHEHVVRYILQHMSPTDTTTYGKNVLHALKETKSKTIAQICWKKLDALEEQSRLLSKLSYILKGERDEKYAYLKKHNSREFIKLQKVANSIPESEIVKIEEEDIARRKAIESATHPATNSAAVAETFQAASATKINVQPSPLEGLGGMLRNYEKLCQISSSEAQKSQLAECQRKIISYLDTFDVLNEQDEYGLKAIHYIAFYGCLPAAQYLHEQKGASFNIKPHEQRGLPINFAVGGDHEDVAIYIVNNSAPKDATSVEENNASLLIAITETQNPNIAKACWNKLSHEFKLEFVATESDSAIYQHLQRNNQAEFKKLAKSLAQKKRKNPRINEKIKRLQAELKPDELPQQSPNHTSPAAPAASTDAATVNPKETRKPQYLLEVTFGVPDLVEFKTDQLTELVRFINKHYYSEQLPDRVIEQLSTIDFTQVKTIKIEILNKELRAEFDIYLKFQVFNILHHLEQNVLTHQKAKFNEQAIKNIKLLKQKFADGIYLQFLNQFDNPEQNEITKNGVKALAEQLRQTFTHSMNQANALAEILLMADPTIQTQAMSFLEHLKNAARPEAPAPLPVESANPAASTAIAAQPNTEANASQSAKSVITVIFPETLAAGSQKPAHNLPTNKPNAQLIYKIDSSISQEFKGTLRKFMAKLTKNARIISADVDRELMESLNAIDMTPIKEIFGKDGDDETFIIFSKLWLLEEEHSKSDCGKKNLHHLKELMAKQLRKNKDLLVRKMESMLTMDCCPAWELMDEPQKREIIKIEENDARKSDTYKYLCKKYKDEINHLIRLNAEKKEKQKKKRERRKTKAASLDLIASQEKTDDESTAIAYDEMKRKVEKAIDRVLIKLREDKLDEEYVKAGFEKQRKEREREAEVEKFAAPIIEKLKKNKDIALLKKYFTLHRKALEKKRKERLEAIEHQRIQREREKRKEEKLKKIKLDEQNAISFERKHILMCALSHWQKSLAQRWQTADNFFKPHEEKRRSKILRSHMMSLLAFVKDQKKAQEFRAQKVAQKSVAQWKKFVSNKKNEEAHMSAKAIEFANAQAAKKPIQLKRNAVRALAQCAAAGKKMRDFEIPIKLSALDKTLLATQRIFDNVESYERNMDAKRLMKLKFSSEKKVKRFRNRVESNWHALWQQFLYDQYNLYDAARSFAQSHNRYEHILDSPEAMARMRKVFNVLKSSPQYDFIGDCPEIMVRRFITYNPATEKFKKSIGFKDQNAKRIDLLLASVRAEDKQLADKLLNEKTINEQNGYRLSPLYCAAANNSGFMTQFLLSKRARITDGTRGTNNVYSVIQGPSVNRLLRDTQVAMQRDSKQAS